MHANAEHWHESQPRFSDAWTKPDVNKVNQPFWTDEITHQAEAND